MSRNKDINPAAILIPVFGLIVCFVMLDRYSKAPPESEAIILAPPGKIVKPVVVKPVEVRPTPPVIPQPRDISSEPTATLLDEWNEWRHGPAPRTAEIQTIYETLLRRGVIRRDGEPVSDGGYGGRRGRRR